MKLQKIAQMSPKQLSTFSSLPCPFFATPFSAGLYHRPDCRVHPALRLSELLQSRRLAWRLRQLHLVLPQRLRLHARPTEADNAVPVSKWFVFRRDESRQGVRVRLWWGDCSKASKSHHAQLLLWRIMQLRTMMEQIVMCRPHGEWENGLQQTQTVALGSPNLCTVITLKVTKRLFDCKL